MSGGPFRTPGVREEEPAPYEEEPAPYDDAFRLQTWESSRHCPGCRSRMFAARCGGVEIDGCDGCGGAWVQAAELAKVQHRATAMAAILAGLTGAAENATATFLEGTRLCPDCAIVLAVVPMWVLAGFDGERVERCKLHGTFFDRNELASFTRAAFGDAPRNAEPITMPTRDGSPPPPLLASEPLKPPHGVALLLDRIADELRRAPG